MLFFFIGTTTSFLQQKKHYKHYKNWRVYIVIMIIIIPLESKVSLRVKKSKVGAYDLHLLRRYAAKDIYRYIYTRRSVQLNFHMMK
jgi:hypothetical protein